VIDSATNKVISTVETGDNLQNLVYNPSNGNIYVMSISNSDGSGQIVVISSNTNKVISTIGVGDDPQDIKYNPSNGNIYVANENSNDVSLIITTKTNSTS
jgi:YVTN family beta-propeller protein